MNQPEDDIILSIDDPAVPEAIRDLGLSFKRPATAVVPHADEYWLFHDEELLDIVSFNNKEGDNPLYRAPDKNENSTTEHTPLPPNYQALGCLIMFLVLIILAVVLYFFANN